MIRIICFIFLLFASDYTFCQSSENTKIQFGVFGGMQLSSTRWGSYLIAQTYSKKNIFHLGVKTPFATKDIYGAFPIGLIGGYGYELINNGTWKMAPVLDIQWVESKTQNQGKATHYLDWTINYQLTYIKWRKVQISSQLGYGGYNRYFYNNYTHKWGKEAGISGLISVAVGYIF